MDGHRTTLPDQKDLIIYLYYAYERAQKKTDMGSFLCISYSTKLILNLLIQITIAYPLTDK